MGDILVQRPKDELSLRYARMGDDEVARKIVQRLSLGRWPGVEDLRVVREDIDVDGTRAVPEGSDTPNSSLDLLDKIE